ncbi:helix-turn-helix domain-containing protein [Solibacillus sp. MA9]|uniref:Helix-turn-helix domain-containing protein n=1 Tax=Solibacillus palustris TaxID=2908203 RepID=A0ABS9UBB8_9BACL|nr:helix-turn-helix domain-containing protein [Solibacillus sp. MA9]
MRTLFEAGENATDIAKEYGIGRAKVYLILKG